MLVARTTLQSTANAVLRNTFYFYYFAKYCKCCTLYFATHSRDMRMLVAHVACGAHFAKVHWAALAWNAEARAESTR